jgi:hypothetical protein
MLLDHDNVDALGVLKREKAESSRTSSSSITHDGTFTNFTELREVALEGVCCKGLVSLCVLYVIEWTKTYLHTFCSLPVQSADEHLAMAEVSKTIISSDIISKSKREKRGASYGIYSCSVRSASA